MTNTLNDRLVMRLDGALEGENWHSPEFGPAGSYRWTGPGERSTLKLAVRRDSEMLAVVAYMGAVTKAHLRRLRMEVDGTNVPFALRRDVRPRCIIARLPKRSSPSQAPTELAFVLPRTVSPVSLRKGGTDERLLGLAVLSVSVIPVRPCMDGSFPISARQTVKRFLRMADRECAPANFPASHFDGLAYLHANPDVAAAVAEGSVRSALHHYCNEGYRQARPFALAVTRSPNPGSLLDLARHEVAKDTHPRLAALKSELSADGQARTAALGNEIAVRMDRIEKSLASQQSAVSGDIKRLEQLSLRRHIEVEGQMSEWASSHETWQRGVRFELDGLRGASAEMQQELATAHSTIRRLGDETQQLSTRFTADLESALAKIHGALPGFAPASELVAARVEVGRASAELETVRGELKRLDQLARDGMERLHAHLSAFATTGEARDRDLSSRVDAVRAEATQAAEAVRGAARTSELARLQQQMANDLQALRAELAASGADEQAVQRQLEAVAAALTGLQQQLAETVRAHDLDAIRTDIATASSVAEARNRDTNRQLDALRAEFVAVAAAREPLRQDNLRDLKRVK